MQLTQPGIAEETTSRTMCYIDFLLGERDYNINIIHTEEPTFYSTNGAHPSTLDILLVKGNMNTNNITVKHTMNSDHLPMLFYIPAGAINTKNKYYKTVN